MISLLKNAFFACLVVFMPIKAIIIVAMVLSIVDLITGVLAAIHRGEHITSNGFSRTLVKIMVYEIAIMTGYLVEQYLTGEIVPVVKILGSLIGMTELKSILENLEAITGQKIFQQIVDLLASKSNKLGD